MHTEKCTSKANRLKKLCAIALLANISLLYAAADNDAWTLIPYDAEITESVARFAYDQYAHKLRGKSKKKLDSLLEKRIEKGYNRLKIIALVHAGATPDRIGHMLGSYPIEQAIIKEDYELVRFLCKHGAKTNRKNRFIDQPIVWRCKSRKMLDLLKDCGANIHVANRLHENILHHTLSFYNAYQAHFVDFISYLLSLEVSIKQINKNGHTPLTSLILYNNIWDEKSAKLFLEIAHLLLASGVETQQHTIYDGRYCTAAEVLRSKGSNKNKSIVVRIMFHRLARTIERYPLRSLQELIIRNAIRDTRVANPVVSKPAQELVALLQAQDTTLHTNNKEIFDRCFDELTPRKVEKIAIISLDYSTKWTTKIL